MAEQLIITAPATSANLGPGFDALGLALDLTNVVRISRRPGPLSVEVTGEGAGEVPADERNLVCRAMAEGLASLDGLHVQCKNRIPLGRGLGSSAAAAAAGLVAANALGAKRWSPRELLARAATLEGHADNAAACLTGGCVVVTPGPVAQPIGLPAELGFVLVIPEARVGTSQSRAQLPAQVPFGDAAATLANGIGLALALSEGRLEDLPDLLHDRLHEPYRAGQVPAYAALRALAGDVPGYLGATISGSGPSVLLWVRQDASDAVVAAAETVLARASVAGLVRASRPTAVGVRARWSSADDTRLARAIG